MYLFPIFVFPALIFSKHEEDKKYIFKINPSVCDLMEGVKTK